MLTLAFALAYVTRFDAFTAPRPPTRETLVTLVLVLVLFPVAYRQSRLYATNRVRTHLEEVFELFKATITGSLVLVALTYFGRERYSRLTLCSSPATRSCWWPRPGWPSGCGWSRCAAGG